MQADLGKDYDAAGARAPVIIMVIVPGRVILFPIEISLEVNLYLR